MGQVQNLTYKDISPNEKFKTLRVMAKEWMPLPPAEFSVVFFVWSRTVFWGKKTERVQFRHFLEGIPGTIGPLPFTRATLRKAINSLVEKGILIREQETWGSRYSLNFSNDDTASPSPKSRKKSRTDQSSVTDTKKYPGRVKNRDRGDVKNDDSYKYENNNLEKDNSEHSVSGDKSPQIERGKLKKERFSTEVLIQKENKPFLRPTAVPVLEKIWLDENKKVYPEYPCMPWTPQECGMTKDFVKKFHALHPDKDVSEFFLFAVRDWNRMKARYFGWMKRMDYPEYPSIKFILSFKDQFLWLFGDEKFRDWSPPTEFQRDVRRLVKMGYTEEQAKNEIEYGRVKSKPLIKMTAERDLARKEAAYALQEAKQLEQENKRLRAQQGKHIKPEDLRFPANDSKPKRKHRYDKDGFIIDEIRGD